MNAKCLIKKYEGFKNKSYKCPAGKWTIGYGFTYNPFTFEQIKEGMWMSKSLADIWLDKFIKNIKEDVDNYFPQIINTNQIEALVSFIYNVGIGNFETSTMFKLLKDCESKKASLEFDKWIYCGDDILPGLVRRREAEKKLFLS